jgi:TPR repeat protein
MYQSGSGVKKDVRAAAKLYEAACGGTDGLGCNNLGTLYELGLIGTADQARATALYEMACAFGEERGCRNVKRVKQDAGASP